MFIGINLTSIKIIKLKMKVEALHNQKREIRSDTTILAIKKKWCFYILTCCHKKLCYFHTKTKCAALILLTVEQFRTLSV